MSGAFNRSQNITKNNKRQKPNEKKHARKSEQYRKTRAKIEKREINEHAENTDGKTKVEKWKNFTTE